MVPNNDGPVEKAMWAYAYEILPPQTEERLRRIKALLDREHSDAELRARTWKSRFIFEKKVTHILVVSDSPSQDHEVNRQLEAELKGIEARFLITLPMAAEDVAGAPSGVGLVPVVPTLPLSQEHI